jgi:hypothetical protein
MRVLMDKIPNEIGYIDLQSRRQGIKRVQRRGLKAPLKLAHIGSVQSASIGKLFLRNTQHVALSSQPQSERLKAISAAPSRDWWRTKTIGLQTIVFSSGWIEFSKSPRILEATTKIFCYQSAGRLSRVRVSEGQWPAVRANHDLKYRITIACSTALLPKI